MPTPPPNPAPAFRPHSALRRRDLLVRAAQLGVGAPALAWLSAACGSGTSGGAASGGASSAAAPIEGQVVLLNYAGWMGKDTPAAFHQKYPKASLKQVVEGSVSSGAVVPAIKAKGDLYDAALGDQAVVAQADAAGVLQQLDFSRIPNIANVDAKFRKAYNKGIPTDYGKVGIGYRTDLVSEDIKGWADVWSLASKYSGKIVFIDLDRDCIGSALKYKGFSTNTTDTSELDQAKQALLDIKGDLQALKSYNIGAGLVNGQTLIAMDWDFDVALAQAREPKIKWVLPEEGATAYLEGFFAVKDTPQLPAVQAFMNFFLEPKQYADFVNTTGTAFVMPSASTFIKQSITGNPALVVDPGTLANVEFENFLGETTADYAKVWDEFKSA